MIQSAISSFTYKEIKKFGTHTNLEDITKLPETDYSDLALSPLKDTHIRSFYLTFFKIMLMLFINKCYAIVQ